MRSVPPTILTSTSSAQQAGSTSADVVYTGCSVTVPPGVWRVDAFASLRSDTASDDKTLCIVANGTEVPNSQGGVGKVPDTTTFSPFSTSCVVRATGPTILQIKAKRNGGSGITIGNSGAGLAVQRITATRIG